MKLLQIMYDHRSLGHCTARL